MRLKLQEHLDKNENWISNEMTSLVTINSDQADNNTLTDDIILSTARPSLHNKVSILAAL